MDLKQLQKEFVTFRDERDWKQFHTPKNLSAAIAIEASELQELFLWKQEHDEASINQMREAIEDEVADVLAFLMGFAEVCEIDIESAFMKKMKKNADKYPAELVKGKSDKYDKY